MPFTEHHIARRDEPLPPVDESLLQDYVLAGNGIFTRGRRPGMEVCLPLAMAPVRGLRPLQPYVQWGYPRVAAEILALIFTVSQTIAKKERREALFYLLFDQNPPATAGGTDKSRPPADAGGSDLPTAPAACSGHLLCWDGWHLVFPEQKGTEHHVGSIHRGPGTPEAEALIEVHSHHEMEAKFSEEDDVDEGAMSFRVYGVIGTIFLSPAIRMRVGLFGHLFEYPASEFFEMPEGVIDCVSFDREPGEKGKG